MFPISYQQGPLRPEAVEFSSILTMSYVCHDKGYDTSMHLIIFRSKGVVEKLA